MNRLNDILKILFFFANACYICKFQSLEAKPKPNEREKKNPTTQWRFDYVCAHKTKFEWKTWHNMKSSRIPDIYRILWVSCMIVWIVLGDIWAKHVQTFSGLWRNIEYFCVIFFFFVIIGKCLKEENKFTITINHMSLDINNFVGNVVLNSGCIFSQSQNYTNL